jgi:nucleotide-binding universal stress UspA family protein
MKAPASRPIVVGPDRSDPGRAAVERAAQLADPKHRPLRLVHVYE